MKSQSSMNTQQVRSQGLDKFYTLPHVAKSCLDKLETYFPWNTWDLVIEPSAGNGSFYNQIPTIQKVGIDIMPENDQLVKMDFLIIIQKLILKLF